MLNEQQFNLFCQIQTSQTGGQPDSDTSLWFSAFISIVFFNVSLRAHLYFFTFVFSFSLVLCLYFIPNVSTGAQLQMPLCYNKLRHDWLCCMNNSPILPPSSNISPSCDYCKHRRISRRTAKLGCWLSIYSHTRGPSDVLMVNSSMQVYLGVT